MIKSFHAIRHGRERGLFDQTFDFACSLKIGSQSWHQSTLNWVNVDYWYSATVIVSHYRWQLVKMLRYTKSSLSFASD